MNKTSIYFQLSIFPACLPACLQNFCPMTQKNILNGKTPPPKKYFPKEIFCCCYRKIISAYGSPFRHTRTIWFFPAIFLPTRKNLPISFASLFVKDASWKYFWEIEPILSKLNLFFLNTETLGTFSKNNSLKRKWVLFSEREFLFRKNKSFSWDS